MLKRCIYHLSYRHVFLCQALSATTFLLLSLGRSWTNHARLQLPFLSLHSQWKEKKRQVLSYDSEFIVLTSRRRFYQAPQAIGLLGGTNIWWAHINQRAEPFPPPLPSLNQTICSANKYSALFIY